MEVLPSTPLYSAQAPSPLMHKEIFMLAAIGTESLFERLIYQQELLPLFMETLRGLLSTSQIIMEMEALLLAQRLVVLEAWCLINKEISMFLMYHTVESEKYVSL